MPADDRQNAVPIDVTRLIRVTASLKYSPTHEQKQLDVDRAPGGAALLDESKDVSARDEVNGDVLILRTATVSYFSGAVSAHEGEAFRDHPRRALKFAQPLDPICSEAGLFLQLFHGSAFDRG